MIDSKMLPSEFEPGARTGLFAEFYSDGQLARFGRRGDPGDPAWIVEIERGAASATARRTEERRFYGLTGATTSVPHAADNETLLREWLRPFIAELRKQHVGHPICLMCDHPIVPPAPRVVAARGSVCAGCVQLAYEVLKEAK